jgi:hypothetical protein
MSNSEIGKIEEQIKVGKQFADFGAAILRLKNNKDFQKVVMQGYFKDEAVRVVMAKSDPFLQNPEAQRSFDLQISGIGNFHAFLNEALKRAEIGTSQVTDGENMLAEIHAEEAKGAQ